jgi:hypothetical protein
MDRSAETEYLSELDKPSYLDLRDHAERYLDRKRLQELRDDRFSASELHNPNPEGNKSCRIARLDPHSLDSAWHWIKTRSAGVVLGRFQQGLVEWFRETAERTFQHRKSVAHKWGEIRQKEKKAAEEWRAAHAARNHRCAATVGSARSE